MIRTRRRRRWRWTRDLLSNFSREVGLEGRKEERREELAPSLATTFSRQRRRKTGKKGIFPSEGLEIIGFTSAVSLEVATRIASSPRARPNNNRSLVAKAEVTCYARRPPQDSPLTLPQPPFQRR